MISLYNKNGLVFWSEDEIRRREYLIDAISHRIDRFLRLENRAFKMHRIEAPILTPVEFLNPNYTLEDVYSLEKDEMILRPETTAGTYEYLKRMMQDSPPPLCAYQAGKSFRREQDQVTKNMRLKEFYQLEFQILYTEDSKNDYYSKAVAVAFDVFRELFPIRLLTILPSDRLPSYSKKTMDIEASISNIQLEICSISLRDDFKETYNGKPLLVTEIAIGLDRLLVL